MRYVSLWEINKGINFELQIHLNVTNDRKSIAELPLSTPICSCMLHSDMSLIEVRVAQLVYEVVHAECIVPTQASAIVLLGLTIYRANECGMRQYFFPFPYTHTGNISN
jgi:hypothetical protein